MIRTLLALSVFAGTLLAQGRVEPENLYPRVICVVPMIGTGTSADPRRPMFVPAPVPVDRSYAHCQRGCYHNCTRQYNGAPAPVSARPPIFAFQFQLSDDGNYALVELVGINKGAFASIFSSAVPGVAVFDAATATRPRSSPPSNSVRATFSMKTFVPVRVITMKTAIRFFLPLPQLAPLASATYTYYFTDTMASYHADVLDRKRQLFIRHLRRRADSNGVRIIYIQGSGPGRHVFL